MSQGHVGVLYPRTYLSWCATAKLVPDLGKETGIESLASIPGLVFGDGGHIEIVLSFNIEGGYGTAKFHCVTGREEIESTSLSEVMDFLWYTHSMNEWPHV